MQTQFDLWKARKRPPKVRRLIGDVKAGGWQLEQRNFGVEIPRPDTVDKKKDDGSQCAALERLLADKGNPAVWFWSRKIQATALATSVQRRDSSSGTE